MTAPECTKNGCNKKSTHIIAPFTTGIYPTEQYFPYCKKHANELHIRGYHMLKEPRFR